MTCHFCGRTIPCDYNITTSLHGNHKQGIDSHSWQEASIDIPCCASCLLAIRKENRNTWLCRITVILATYLVCVGVVAAFIRAETILLAICAGGVLSLLPAFIVFVILVGLTPMPFTPAWQKKVSSLPNVYMLLTAGFKLRLSVKESFPLAGAISLMAGNESLSVADLSVADIGENPRKT